MLKLLLDEHISPAVAEGVRVRSKTPLMYGLVERELLGLSDEMLLREAAVQKLTLVTYDRKAIPPLLKSWLESGRDHGGVIFVDEKTIAPSDIGGLIRSLRELSKEGARWDWTNRVCFLRR